MIDFGRNHGGVFASASLVAHLVRGVFAALVMITAVRCQTAAPLASLAFGVAALVTPRGCPVCWTIGLFETLTDNSSEHVYPAPKGPPEPLVSIGASRGLVMRTAN
jgi:hypothetical protein